jgi:hypothetical protein
LKKKAHVVMDLCQSDGYLTRTTISKASAWNIPHFYSAIRKLRWGGIVPALPVSVHDLSAHDEKDPEKKSEGPEEAGFRPILVMSPLARHRPSTSPAVRRDIKPPVKVEKNLFREGEGPHQRYERNRDARESGMELYQTTRTQADRDAEDAEFLSDPDMPKNEVEDAELAEMLRDETEDLEIMTKYGKTMEAMLRDERLIGRPIDGSQDDDDYDVTQVDLPPRLCLTCPSPRPVSPLPSLVSQDETREKLAGYDSSDNEDMTEEEQHRLANMTEDDWQEWQDILEGKDTLRKKPHKRDEDGEALGALPAPTERRRRKTPIAEPGSGRAERKGSSSNTALFANLMSKTKDLTDAAAASSSPPAKTPSAASPAKTPSTKAPTAPSTGGRKKPVPAPRRTKKTEE